MFNGFLKECIITETTIFCVTVTYAEEKRIISLFLEVCKGLVKISY